MAVARPCWTSWRTEGVPSLWLTRTRPLDSNPLAQSLERAGWTVINLPLLEIEPCAWTPTELAAIRRKIDAADWVLWTSVHAAKALPASLFASVADGALHAVGSRTASVARKQLGRPVDYPKQGHGGAAWAAAMQGRWQPGQRVLVVTGENGHTGWHAAVEQAGLTLELLPVYRRHACTLQLPGELPDAVIATSGSALAALDGCGLSAKLLETPIILPADRLNSVAREAGWSGRIANVPDLSSAAVLAALEECR